MPAPRDLAGRVYGDLKVIKLAAINPNISKNRQIWLCYCSRCGRHEEIGQNLLPFAPYMEKKRGVRYACSVCMRGTCEICGEEIEQATYKGVCSEACHSERSKANARNFHYRRLAENPDYWRDTARKRRERIEDDPKKLEQARAKSREKSRKAREKNGEQINAQAREAYHRNREAVIARRQERSKAMSEEDRLLLEGHRREYSKEYWSLNGEKVSKERKQKLEAMTPEDREQYVEARRKRNREYYRATQNRKALNSILQIGGQLDDFDDKK